MSNIAACHRCEFRQRPCAGACLCTINGETISDNAAAGVCPKGYFDKPQPTPKLFDDSEQAIVDAIDNSPEGLGDTVKTLLDAIGVDRATKLFEKIAHRSCGCDARRKWLNKFWPYANRP